MYDFCLMKWESPFFCRLFFSWKKSKIKKFQLIFRIVFSYLISQCKALSLLLPLPLKENLQTKRFRQVLKSKLSPNSDLTNLIFRVGEIKTPSIRWRWYSVRKFTSNIFGFSETRRRFLWIMASNEGFRKIG